MTATEVPTTISELAILGIILFYDNVHTFLLFVVTHDLFRQLLIDYKEVIGALVGTLGLYYMILKIKREKKKSNESEKKN